MREFKLSAFPSDFQFMCTIVQLLDFDWPANILARLNFRAQENGLLAQARLGTRLPFSNTAGQIFLKVNFRVCDVCTIQQQCGANQILSVCFYKWDVHTRFSNSAG